MGQEYQQTEAKMQMIVDQLSEYASEETVFELQQIQQNFKKKVADFYREGRKLNIGVIGRVKAGKSSFLNTRSGTTAAIGSPLSRLSLYF